MNPVGNLYEAQKKYFVGRALSLCLVLRVIANAFLDGSTCSESVIIQLPKIIPHTYLLFEIRQNKIDIQRKKGGTNIWNWTETEIAHYTETERWNYCMEINLWAIHLFMPNNKNKNKNKNVKLNGFHIFFFVLCFVSAWLVKLFLGCPIFKIYCSWFWQWEPFKMDS